MNNQVQIQHIYWVDFNPAESGEFPDKHLAVVIGVNSNSCRVVPLTRSSQGLGQNKICLNVIPPLKDISFAVLDQVRTISINRMSQNNGIDNIQLDNALFYELKINLMKKEELGLNQVDLMKFHSNRVVELKKKHIINLLYAFKKEHATTNHFDLVELEKLKIKVQKEIDLFEDLGDYIKSHEPGLINILEELNISVIALNLETA